MGCCSRDVLEMVNQAVIEGKRRTELHSISKVQGASDTLLGANQVLNGARSANRKLP